MCSLASYGRGPCYPFIPHHRFRGFRLINTLILTISPAQILASASYDDTIKLYLDDPSDDWFCAATLTGHGSTVWTLAWEPLQGGYLASGSDDGTIRIWRRLPVKGELRFDCVAVLEGHDRSVYSISWSPAPPSAVVEGEQRRELGLLASTGGDGTVLIWQITVSTAHPPSFIHALIALFDLYLSGNGGYGRR